MTLYRVRDWSEHFETCETRKYKSLTWWPKPNKHDGLGFRRMAGHRDRVALYCAWNLICDVASKTTPKESRGMLARDGKALTAEDLEFMTGFPANIFSQAFLFFSSVEIAWLEKHEIATENENSAAVGDRDEISDAQAPNDEPFLLRFDESPATPGESAANPGDCPATTARIEENRIEEKVGANGFAPTSDPFESWLRELRADAAYKGIDVGREFAKMVRWCKTNNKKPSKRRFINWLNRCDSQVSDEAGYLGENPMENAI